MQTKGVILKNFTEIEKVFEQNNVQRPFVCCGKSFEKPIFLNISKNLISLFLTISDQIRALRIWLLRQSFSKRTIAIL